MSDNERIAFQVPTPEGMVDVSLPLMSAHDAYVAAERVAGVIRAMFQVVPDDLRRPSSLPSPNPSLIGKS